MNSIPIHKSYKPLYNSDKRYFLVTGGRGSLKSTSAHDYIVRLTYETGHGVLFTRYTMTSAEKSIIPEFKLAIEKLGAQNDFHITKTGATNKQSGSFVYFSGIKTSSGDQTANLKSIAGITTWVIDEGEDFTDEKAFDTIDDSIRTTSRQNRVIWIQNPSTKEHFIYKRWIEQTSKQCDFGGYKVTMSTDPTVEHIHTWYKIAENLGYLSDAWIAKAERSLIQNPKWYYHNYVGGWLEKAEGVVFEDWIEGEFDETLPYVYSMDYGFNPDPLALVKVAVDKKALKIYVKEYAYALKLSIDDIEAILTKSLKRPKDLVLCDTNESRTTDELRRRRFNIQAARKYEIADDIRNMSPYTIVVDPDSHNVKKELNNYIWNDKKSSTPIGEYNHTLDPTRYGFNKLTRMPVSKSTVSRFSRK